MAQITICFSNEQHPLFEGEELWGEIFAHGVVLPDPPSAPPPPAPGGEPILPSISAIQAMLDATDDFNQLVSSSSLSKIPSMPKISSMPKIPSIPKIPSKTASEAHLPLPPPTPTPFPAPPTKPPASTFPEPYQFVLCQLYFRYTPNGSTDSIALFDLDSSELIAFNDSFERLVECPQPVLRSGFRWSNLHFNEYTCSEALKEHIDQTLSRVMRCCQYLSTEGPKSAVFDETVLFVNARGNIKRMKLQIAGMGRRMLWLMKELSIDDLFAPTPAPVQEQKRSRRNKTPKRKKKVWDSQMVKFTVDKKVCYPLMDL